MRQALEYRPGDPNNLALEYRIGVLLSQYWDPEHPQPRRPEEAVEAFEHIVASYRHMDYYSRHPVNGSDDLQFKIPRAAIHLASLDSRPGQARHWSHFAMARLAETFERRQADWLNQPPPPEVREDDPLGGPRERAKWESRMHAWQERKRRAREGDVFGTLEMGVVEQAFRRYRNSFGWLRPSETVVAMGQIVRDFPGTPMARLAQGRIDRARKRTSRAVAEGDSGSAALNQDPNEIHVAMEILDRPAFREAMPAGQRITLREYEGIKDKYIRNNPAWRPGFALTYRVREEDQWRGYWLALVSFESARATIAELTQFQSRGWDWIAVYHVDRCSGLDGDFAIGQILADRARVVGGVQYGMRAAEVIQRKGQHFKVHNHAESGSATLVYDDVRVGVRQWHPGTDRGRVTRVEPTTDQIKAYMKDIPYEDEK